MTSIIFELGRDLAKEIQAGKKAHQDVQSGKEVERREDKWGDPIAPKTVYSVVRGVEEGFGKIKSLTGKGKAPEIGEKDKEEQSDIRTVVNPRPSSSPDLSISPSPSLDSKDAVDVPQVSLKPTHTADPSKAEPSAPDTDGRTPSKFAVIANPPDEERDNKSDGTHLVSTHQKPLPLDGVGSPLPRESRLSPSEQPPPPPPPTQADKIQKNLKTIDDIAAEIALGVLTGVMLDGPTQTLVEGLIMIDNEETPRTKKNREGLKAARKQIDKYTPKREEIARKVAAVQEKLDAPRGGRSEKEHEKDQKKYREKINEVRRELEKVEGKLEAAEFDVGKFKPRVEEHERLCRQKKAAKRILQTQEKIKDDLSLK